MPKVETKKVKSDAHPSGYIIVNADDARAKEERPKQEVQRRKRRNSSDDTTGQRRSD